MQYVSWEQIFFRFIFKFSVDHTSWEYLFSTSLWHTGVFSEKIFDCIIYEHRPVSRFIYSPALYDKREKCVSRFAFSRSHFSRQKFSRSELSNLKSSPTSPAAIFYNFLDICGIQRFFYYCIFIYLKLLVYFVIKYEA